jgi:hypothetical protein|tara:strand:+ start:4328 stop:4948 length:621 start_codon:yes stop_codon:yes gene_type:complete
MSKYLLTEYYELCPNGTCEDLLTEAEKQMVKNGSMFLTGVMQRAEAKNGNGRRYPRNVLQREVENYKKLVRDRRAVGELDHPDSDVVNLKNSSHIVTDIWWDGDDVKGKVQILTTPSGQILRNLIEGGVKLGISSRGLGSVAQATGGDTIVQDDFQLICFDFVSEPSTTGAFMVKEGKERNNAIVTKADRINRALNNILKPWENNQ